jgi:hypothetical protein
MNFLIIVYHHFIKRAKRREFPAKLQEYEELEFATSNYKYNVLKLKIITN